MQERSASKRLVQILLLIGIGIPVLIEAATLVRLIGGHLGGEEEQGRSAVSDSASVVVVEEGDELLPATEPTETVARMYVRAEPEAWHFVLEVDVENAAEHPYELTLHALELRRGETVDGEHAERRAPGEIGRLAARWTLPVGELPVSVEAEGRFIGAPDSLQATARRIHFGRIPVRMRE